MKFDRKTFFDSFRPFYKNKRGVLDASTVQAVEFLLDAFENQNIITSIPQIAYCWGTIAHETDWKFKPIREYRAKVGSKGRANQDRYWLTGYYGRGYVQITWKRNYKLLGSKIGVDLVNSPDLALKPEVAFKILIVGMSQGLFTGKKLSDYIYGVKKDYEGARKVINGTDKKDLIAGYAEAFEDMLGNAAARGYQLETAIENTALEVTETATVQTAQGEITQTVQPVTETAQVTEPQPQGVFTKLTGGIGALFSGTLVYTVAEKFGNISMSQTGLILVIVAIIVAFLGFCFWAVLDAWKQNNRTKYEFESKTRTDRKDLEWKK